MKRISFLAGILFVCFVSAASAQQPAVKASLGGHMKHRMANLLSKAQKRVHPGNYLASAITFDKSKG